MLAPISHFRGSLSVPDRPTRPRPGYLPAEGKRWSNFRWGWGWEREERKRSGRADFSPQKLARRLPREARESSLQRASPDRVPTDSLLSPPLRPQHTYTHIHGPKLRLRKEPAAGASIERRRPPGDLYSAHPFALKASKQRVARGYEAAVPCCKHLEGRSRSAERRGFPVVSLLLALAVTDCLQPEDSSHEGYRGCKERARQESRCPAWDASPQQRGLEVDILRQSLLAGLLPFFFSFPFL